MRWHLALIAVAALGASEAAVAREMTTEEALTKSFIEKMLAGSVSNADVLDIQFHFRLPKLEPEPPGGNTIPAYLAVVQGCSSTNVLQRDRDAYDIPQDQEIVEAVIDCAARDADPMLLRVVAIFMNGKMTYVMLSRGLQVGDQVRATPS